jgi:hypothetical protein
LMPVLASKSLPTACKPATCATFQVQTDKVVCPDVEVPVLHPITKSGIRIFPAALSNNLFVSRID